MNQTALTLLCAAVVGTVLCRRYPFPSDDLLLRLTWQTSPWLYGFFHWSWSLMLYTTPALGFAGMFSLVYVFVGLGSRQAKGKLPPFPAPKDSEPLHLVIGEVHHPHRVAQVDNPGWLTIPSRGLYTGIAVFGSIGSGKTSACLRPFATQILCWRAQDQVRKVGGIVLEVKGDFCCQVREILEGAGRGEDYVELNVDGKYRYNPLQNDL